MQAQRRDRSSPRQPQDVEREWVQLEALVAKREKLLSEAHEIHVFIRDASETLDRIREKDAVLSSDDYGRDVAGVEALLRKHDGVQRDLIAVGESVAAHIGEASRLIGAYADRVADVKSKKGQVEQAWEALQQKAGRRKKKLDDALNLQRFLVEFRDSVSWITDMTARVQAEDVPGIRDVTAAAALAERHDENKGEIDARQSAFDHVQQTGQALIDAGHYAAATLKQCIDELTAERRALDELWKARQWEYVQCHDQQTFVKDGNQIAEWIDKQEQVIANKPTGESIDAVLALLKKHGDFEKSLKAQEEKMRALTEACERLVAYGHYDKDGILALSDTIVRQRKALTDHTAQRRVTLEDSYANQQHRRDTEEVLAWIEEKLAVAGDEAHKDTSNIKVCDALTMIPTHVWWLQLKVKKHAEFEQEVSANVNGIQALEAQGRRLVDGYNFARADISARIALLLQQWKQLQAKTAEKAQNLKEAKELVEFQREVREIRALLAAKSDTARSAEVGLDVEDCETVQKKFDDFSLDVFAQEKRVAALGSEAIALVLRKHPQTIDISAQKDV